MKLVGLFAAAALTATARASSTPGAAAGLHLRSRSPRELQIDIPDLGDLLDNIPDGIRDLIDNILAKLDIPDLENLINDAISNGIPEDVLEDLLNAADTGKALSPEQAAEVEKYLSNGESLPQELTIPGLQDLIDKIPADIRNLIDNILANNNVPNLDDLVAGLENAVANGLPEDVLQDVLATVQAGKPLSPEQVSEVESYMNGASLPPSLTAAAAPGAPQTTETGLPVAAIVGSAAGVVGVVGLAFIVSNRRKKSATQAAMTSWQQQQFEQQQQQYHEQFGAPPPPPPPQQQQRQQMPAL